MPSFLDLRHVVCYGYIFSGVESSWGHARKGTTMANQILILSMTTKTIPVAPLSEAVKAALLDEWRGILSGTLSPEVIFVPPEVDELVAGEIRRMPGKPSAEAEARMRLEQFLEHTYPGQTVLCMKTSAGTAVIAAGEEESDLFWQTFPWEIGVRVDVHYPPLS
jgi:hypothetical protein